MDADADFPPPVYAPDVVAEAILYCAGHPERDVFVGAGGKVPSASGHMAPRTTDRMMERNLFDRQQKPDVLPSRRDALFAPSEDLAERGDYEGHTMESSPYTKASLHPWITAGLMIGAGVVAAALLSATREDD